jgi:hypothetical protein
MKKTLGFICLITLVCGMVFAQEEGAQEGVGQQATADPRAAMAAEGIIMPGQVTTPMGKFTLHGMMMTGVQAYLEDNTAVDNSDEEWKLMAWDPIWQRSAVNLSLTYENGKYGGYISMLAADWDGRIERGFNDFYIDNAYMWRDFFGKKLRTSIGMLIDNNIQTRESVWKAEGATNGGWSLNDNYQRYAALRLEYKPVNGLNIGMQFNFLPLTQNDDPMDLAPSLAESFKEVSVGAEYKGDLFNAVAGVRFDGADGMNKFDAWTYLKDYYGEWGYIANGSQTSLSTYPASFLPGGTRPPLWKHRDKVYGTVYDAGNSQSVFTVGNADKPFSGSHRLIFGFNFKGVKNLTAKMQGAFFNLGDFDRFGTGSFDETIAYTFTPKFRAGINFYQEFYGSDAFPDEYVNAPYFRFEPTASYQITSNISANFLAAYGIAKDVIDYYWRIRPGFTFTLGGFGAMRAELYYELEATAWTAKAISSSKSAPGVYDASEAAGYPPGTVLIPMEMPGLAKAKAGDPIYKHNICLSVMWMF